MPRFCALTDGWRSQRRTFSRCASACVSMWLYTSGCDGRNAGIAVASNFRSVLRMNFGRAGAGAVPVVAAGGWAVHAEPMSALSNDAAIRRVDTATQDGA